jgi:hypothetical protein
MAAQVEGYRTVAGRSDRLGHAPPRMPGLAAARQQQHRRGAGRAERIGGEAQSAVPDED